MTYLSLADQLMVANEIRRQYYIAEATARGLYKALEEEMTEYFAKSIIQRLKDLGFFPDTQKQLYSWEIDANKLTREQLHAKSPFCEVDLMFDDGPLHVGLLGCTHTRLYYRVITKKGSLSKSCGSISLSLDADEWDVNWIVKHTTTPSSTKKQKPSTK